MPDAGAGDRTNPVATDSTGEVVSDNGAGLNARIDGAQQITFRDFMGSLTEANVQIPSFHFYQVKAFIRSPGGRALLASDGDQIRQAFRDAYT
jgi:hypothetical protein